MVTQEKLLTAEDLLDLPDDGQRHELLDGKLVEMAPTGGWHGKVESIIGYLLRGHVETDDLGEVLVGEPGIILHRNPDRVRAPDVCFFTRARLPAEALPDGYFEIVPDLIVEVISPNDRAGEVLDKIQEWLEAGARLVWAVYPTRRSVVAYHDDGTIQLHTDRDTLSGAPVLPEFICPVARFFD